MSSRSETIGKLAEALAKAQGQIEGAKKDQANPFFKSKYADLSSCWDACRRALADNGLAVIQMPTLTENGAAVETILSHASGEWISEKLELPVAKADAQGVGSAITYARRYALSSFIGIAPEDDDGNAAADSSKNLRSKALAILELAAKKGTACLETAWKSVSNDMRKVCQGDLAALKQTAAKEENHATPAA